METARRALGAAAGALVAALVLGLGAASGHSTQLSCGAFDAVALADGLYMFQQNEWNSSLKQCASVSGTGFRMTAAGFKLPNAGPPATYPSIYRGCHWTVCTQRSGLPLKVSALRSARTTWVTVQPQRGAYDVAYDLWTNTRPTAAGQPDGSEIMIWLASRGGVQPFGKQVATVKLAGTRWEVWTGRQSSWNIVSYRRVVPTTTLRNVDLKAFVDDSVRRDVTKRSWYLIDGEAGFEIWRGGVGLATTRFALAPR
jgi:cellulose 1,4-beta-cellobiosidase